ncbi:hypothetical protein [Methylomonas sp. AM2-LC]|uniref:hypothetical protein n=1 Tax=Methylomonas sp. AM2-LC TaxID=3153301 RepID=UPI00326511F9
MKTNLVKVFFVFCIITISFIGNISYAAGNNTCFVSDLNEPKIREKCNTGDVIRFLKKSSINDELLMTAAICNFDKSIIIGDTWITCVIASRRNLIEVK